MKKIVIILILTTLISLSLTGCVSDKDRLIGTWQYAQGGTITFFQNNTVTVTNFGQILEVQLNGVFTYSISDHNITFASRGQTGITFSFRYSFPNDKTLVLTRSNTQLTLAKIS